MQHCVRLRAQLTETTDCVAAKGGLSEAVQVVELASHVVHQCPQLTFSGLMTIGKPGETSDFEVCPAVA